MDIVRILKTRKCKGGKTFEIIFHVDFGDVLLLLTDFDIDIQTDIQTDKKRRSYKDIFAEFGARLDEIASS